jgi:multisubunit Na+/H+ antiporter MnhB subunit
MALPAQNFQNHKRYFPLFHFIAAPLLALYLLYAIYALVRAPSLATAAGLVLAAGVFAALFASRAMAATVQNRVIRLEMSMRLERVLGAAVAADAIAKLPLRQIIALRFASDAELPALVARVLSNDLPTNVSVKQAIREWQPDYLRA